MRIMIDDDVWFVKHRGKRRVGNAGGAKTYVDNHSAERHLVDTHTLIDDAGVIIYDRKMSVDQISVHQMSVDQISVNQMSVNQKS